MSEIKIPTALLEKVAQFIGLADAEVTRLTEELNKKPKVASEVKTEVKEVAKVPETVAKTAAQALVENGLLSAEYLDRKTAELADPKHMAETLAKVASLYASKPTTALGKADPKSTQKVAATKEDRLAEARSRFAKNIGL